MNIRARGPSARPPHPATVAQPKSVVGKAVVRPPHAATTAQAKRAFGNAVTRPPHAAAGAAPKTFVAQRANLETHFVISGHGAFSVLQLQTEKRKKLATFELPPRVSITFYAPDGAALENGVANRIEVGDYPAADELEMKMKDANKKAPLPGGYPRTFGPGEEVINYTLSAPSGLNVIGGPNVVTVEEPTSLYELVGAAVLAIMKGGTAHLHWAACGSFYADAFDELFEWKGWYCRLK